MFKQPGLPTMKLCKDCANYIKDEVSAAFDRCSKRQLNHNISLVRGEPAAFGFCEQTRAEIYCGEEARWFVPAKIVEAA